MTALETPGALVTAWRLQQNLSWIRIYVCSNAKISGNIVSLLSLSIFSSSLLHSVFCSFYSFLVFDHLSNFGVVSGFELEFSSYIEA